MSQTTKQFAEHLNTALDDVGIPTNLRERAAILAKMLSIPKQQAWTFVEGLAKPDSALLQALATELDIDLASLLNETKA